MAWCFLPHSCLVALQLSWLHSQRSRAVPSALHPLAHGTASGSCRSCVCWTGAACASPRSQCGGIVGTGNSNWQRANPLSDRVGPRRKKPPRPLCRCISQGHRSCSLSTRSTWLIPKRSIDCSVGCTRLQATALVLQLLRLHVNYDRPLNECSSTVTLTGEKPSGGIWIGRLQSGGEAAVPRGRIGEAGRDWRRE